MITDKGISPVLNAGRKKNHCIAFTSAKGLLQKGRLQTEAVPAWRILEKRDKSQFLCPHFCEPCWQANFTDIHLHHSFASFTFYIREASWLTEKSKRDRCSRWGRLRYNWTCKHLQATVIFTIIWITLSWVVLMDPSGAMQSWVQSSSSLIHCTTGSGLRYS